MNEFRGSTVVLGGRTASLAMFVCLDLTRLRVVKRSRTIRILNRFIMGEEGARQNFRWTEGFAIHCESERVPFYFFAITLLN